MDWVASLWIPLVKAVLVVLSLLLAGAYMTWGERKICARFQVRYGPNRAGPFGILQPLADAVKAIFKEEIVPAHVADVPAQIDARVTELIDWLVGQDLRQWSAVADHIARGGEGREDRIVGRGVPRDYEKALDWFRLAADQGTEF